MPTSALVGLAYLNVTWRREGRSYIDNFIPMVCELARSSDEEVITEPAIQQGLHDHFGLNLPRHTIGTLLRRARRRGFLRADGGVFRPRHEALNNTEFSNRRDEVNTLYEATVQRLTAYCRAELGLDWSDETADHALQAYLAHYSFDVLLSAHKRSVVPEAPGGPRERLIVSLYVRHLQQEEPGVFELVSDLFRGAMLANALFVSDPHNVEERFANVTVYLDSPLLLAAAGYGYDDRVLPTQELAKLLADLGAQLAAFESTVEEARGILEACAAIMRANAYSDAYDPVRENIDYFYENGLLFTDVDRLAANLDAKLESLGISIRHRPEYDRDYGVDEVALEEHLGEEVGHRRREALEHDAEVIGNIARLRRGQAKHSLERCDAIFVTHNTDLARAARQFFEDDRLQGSVALAITDYHMTNAAWLKQPTSAPDLPLRKVLADCHAAIQPSDKLWSELMREIDRLHEQGDISVEEYVTLRHSREIKTALAEETLNDVEAFSTGTVPQVLERARRKREREIQETLEAERQRREDAITNLESHDRITRDRLATIAGWLGKFSGGIAVVAGLAVLSLGLYTTFPWNWPRLEEAVANYIWSTVLVLLFILLLWSGFFGLGAIHISKWVSTQVRRRSYIRLLDWWDLTSNGEE